MLYERLYQRLFLEILCYPVTRLLTLCVLIEVLSVDKVLLKNVIEAVRLV